MRWFLILPAIALSACPIGSATLAADALQERLYEICHSDDAGWIGKSEKEIKANCICKAKSETAMASPQFRDAILKAKVYDPLLLGDSAKYLKQVLTDCPSLRPLMIQAVCSDPAAPPDTCAAFKDMVSKLK
jgi:hypothetical protein